MPTPRRQPSTKTAYDDLKLKAAFAMQILDCMCVEQGTPLRKKAEQTMLDFLRTEPPKLEE